jgi:hypothetical protein
MVTTRKSSSDVPDEGTGTDTRTSGFSEDERSELAAMIAEAVGAAKPPAARPDAPPRPTVTDSEWDAMSDRKRESWVRDLVVSVLDDLAHDDEEARLRADVDQLKKDKEPEPEAPPSVVTKVQRILWGDPDKGKK